MMHRRKYCEIRFDWNNDGSGFVFDHRGCGPGIQTARYGKCDWRRRGRDDGGKSRGKDAVLSKFTVVLGILFAVLCLVLGRYMNTF